MNKNIYTVRHCKATGQAQDDPLTEDGFHQADDLADFLSNLPINRIITSPYLRAKQSIEPLCKKLQLTYTVDNRLSERVLSTKELPNWFDLLKESFDNMDMSFDGGESSREATTRVIDLVNKIRDDEDENTLLVTHGNIMALLLKYFDSTFGFEEWKNLSNPDVYCINFSNDRVKIKRLWK